MSSPTEIANQAISHLGIAKEIANIDTENSGEARACRRFFSTCRDAVLRDFPWPFATKFAVLGLVATDPTEEWGYSYRYPSDSLKFRRILSDTERNDTVDSRVPYKIGSDDTGELIYTDKQDAECEYTVKVTATEKFSPDFILALSLRLAAYIAPRITAGDPFKLGARAMQLYMAEIGLARASAIGEEQPDRPPESEFIEGRN